MMDEENNDGLLHYPPMCAFEPNAYNIYPYGGYPTDWKKTDPIPFAGCEDWNYETAVKRASGMNNQDLYLELEDIE